MELRQLRYFTKAAETLNFSEAAKNLNITQSTLSQQIHQLEIELDTLLFFRNSHVVSLTESGVELIPFALKTLHDAEACVVRINDLKKLLTGTLNIGATYTFSPMMTETLLEFMKLYPQVKLNIYYKPMAELMNMLLNRDVDFVLAFRPTGHYENIQSQKLFDNHLAIILREYHPLAKKPKLHLSELEHYSFALPVKGIQARNALEKMLTDTVYKLNIRLELNDANILLDIIRQSNMLSVLSEATIHNEKGVRAIPLDMEGSMMEGCVHTLKGVYKKNSATKFIELLSQSNAIRERMKEAL